MISLNWRGPQLVPFHSVPGFIASHQFTNKEDLTKQAAGICVCIHCQPAIDAGGVCRQFFAVVFAELARTESDCSLFERPPIKLRPVFKASILSLKVLSTVGTMIAHSLLLDGQRFPYLSEYCYYIAGCYVRQLV